MRTFKHVPCRFRRFKNSESDGRSRLSQREVAGSREISWERVSFLPNGYLFVKHDRTAANCMFQPNLSTKPLNPVRKCAAWYHDFKEPTFCLFHPKNWIRPPKKWLFAFGGSENFKAGVFHPPCHVLGCPIACSLIYVPAPARDLLPWFHEEWSMWSMSAQWNDQLNKEFWAHLDMHCRRVWWEWWNEMFENI